LDIFQFWFDILHFLLLYHRFFDLAKVQGHDGKRTMIVMAMMASP
jgi:hypothetical protein